MSNTPPPDYSSDDGPNRDHASNIATISAYASHHDVTNITASTANLTDPKKVKDRANWGNNVEFILTCVGYAVGLGNVWRFPYLCYKNGGGAFLIPYFIMLVLVGIPLFFMELSFGQFASQGPISIWKVNPLFKGLGYASVIVNTCIGVYYNVIIAWCIYYFFASMTSQLPWVSCDNWWNTEKCIPLDVINNETMLNETLANYSLTKKDIKASTEEYFYNRVLNMSGGIEEPVGIQWQLALCLLLAWIVVFFVLIKGISSLGKVVYFSSVFPYVLLTVMLVRGVTLDGALDGILFYIKPDFTRLFDATVWSDAAVQIFFSLSVCTGGLTAMASYNQFKNNCLRDSILVPLINCATSFFAGFVIFSVLGYMAKSKGVDVSEVAASDYDCRSWVDHNVFFLVCIQIMTVGPGLVFVVYPEGLMTMPLSPLWAVLFFFMMLLLGFSSEFSIMECFFASFGDEFAPFLLRSRKRNIIFRLVFCCLFFAITLAMVTQGGFYLVAIFDNYVGGFPLLMVGLGELVALPYAYGYENFASDIEMMLGKKPNYFFKYTWLVISPILLTAIVVFKAIQYRPLTLFDTYQYPDWAMGVAWLLVVVPMIFLPVWFVASFCYRTGWKALKEANKELPTWGPADRSNWTNDRYRKKAAVLQELQKGQVKESIALSAQETPYNGDIPPIGTQLTGGLDNEGYGITHF